MAEAGRPMIAVIFELWPETGRRDDYFDRAANLRPLLDQIDGFISVERFESLSQPGKFLSLSFFRNEAALAEWRQTADHRAAQSAGRSGVFADYRLRVAEIIRDYGMSARGDAPKDSLDLHG